MESPADEQRRLQYQHSNRYYGNVSERDPQRSRKSVLQVGIFLALLILMITVISLTGR